MQNTLEAGIPVRPARIYAGIGETLPYGIWICEPDGTAIYVSVSLLELAGTTFEECRHTGWLNCIPLEDTAGALADWKRCRESGCLWNRELKIPVPGGGYRTILSRGAPVRDAEGRIALWAGINLDITARREAEHLTAVRAAQQAAIAALGQFALAGAGPREQMDAAVRAVAGHLGGEYAKVLRYLPGQDAFLLEAAVGFDGTRVGTACVEGGTDSQAGYTLLSCEPVIVEDLRTEARFRGPALLRDEGIVSGISVIIQGKRAPYGVLGAHTRNLLLMTATPHNGKEEDFQLFLSLLDTADSAWPDASLGPDDIATLLDRAVTDPRGLDGAVSLAADARDHIVRVAGSDARKALTILEAAADAVGEGEVTLEGVEAAVDVAAVRYDRGGDQHYDVISAFIKSMRGSDVDAALHYLARMVVAGEDPRFIARRIMIAAAEDVGMADPTALTTAVAAAQAVALIGMPEARIILAEAVIHVATAPKSNAGYLAIDAAIADVRAGRAGTVPAHLRDAHYRGAESLGHGAGYRYAHDDPRGVTPQRHLPGGLEGSVYYRPTGHGNERQITARLERIRQILAED